MYTIFPYIEYALNVDEKFKRKLTEWRFEHGCSLCVRRNVATFKLSDVCTYYRILIQLTLNYSDDGCGSSLFLKEQYIDEEALWEEILHLWYSYFCVFLHVTLLLSLSLSFSLYVAYRLTKDKNIWRIPNIDYIIKLMTIHPCNL